MAEEKIKWENKQMGIVDENVFIKKASNRDCGRVQELVFGILREYGMEPSPSGLDLDLFDIERAYFAGGGIFEILENEKGEIIGTYGLAKIDSDNCELKKMYLLKKERGRGLGRLLLQRAILKARELKFTRMELETVSILKEAVSLYRHFGFIRFNKEKFGQYCDQAFELDL